MGFDIAITDERDVKTFIARAGEAIQPYRVLITNGDPDGVMSSNDASYFPIGISSNASENAARSYEENDSIIVKYAGIVYLQMSGVGGFGDRVMSVSEGLGIRHDTELNVWVIGIALQFWTDGQIIPVEIQKQFFIDTGV